MATRLVLPVSAFTAVVAPMAVLVVKALWGSDSSNLSRLQQCQSLGSMEFDDGIAFLLGTEGDLLFHGHYFLRRAGRGISGCPPLHGQP